MKKLIKAVAALMLMTTIVCAIGCKKTDKPITVSGSYGGHDYVDLGLPSGTLWATCNVGSDTPEGYGDYFAWGETQPKTYFDWNTYKFSDVDSENNIRLTKYNTNSDFGIVDSLSTLEIKDDAATSQWGSGWCLPTLEQWEELRNNTTGIWTVRNGSSGFLFTANNGRCLFLPATTIASPYTEEVSHLSGSYWSNLLYSNSPHFAWAFCFHIDGIYDIYRTDRYHGMAVRPVCSAK